MSLNYKAKLVGQCYDGAANMSGVKNGLHKKIKSFAKKALYLHCYAHQLNLALQHSCCEIKKARNCLDVLNSLHEFIEGSAKRHSLFESLQDPKFSTVLKHLSDTRWASRHLALFAMKNAYSSVIKFLEVRINLFYITRHFKFNVFSRLKLVDENENNAAGAKASGLLLQIRDFDFLFFVYSLNELFRATDSLHKTLQNSTLDISTALEFAEITIKQLIDMKTDTKYYDSLFGSMKEFAEENDISLPSISKKRGRQSIADLQAKRQRCEIDPEQKYRDLFVDVVDVFINHLSEKFQSDNYKPLIAISKLLTDKTKPEISEIFFDLVIYREEFNIDELDDELKKWFIYKSKNEINCIKDIHEEFKKKT